MGGGGPGYQVQVLSRDPPPPVAWGEGKQDTIFTMVQAPALYSSQL